MHVLALFTVLLGIWVLLSGQFTWMLFGSGVVCSIFVTYIAFRKRIADREGQPVHIITIALLYWPWLLYQIFIANIDVAYRVWHPRLPISPRLFKAPLKTKSDLGAVIYANSITLTPGTVTVDVNKRSLLVHALSADSQDSVLDDNMQTRVKKLERNL